MESKVETPEKSKEVGRNQWDEEVRVVSSKSDEKPVAISYFWQLNDKKTNDILGLISVHHPENEIYVERCDRDEGGRDFTMPEEVLSAIEGFGWVSPPHFDEVIRARTEIKDLTQLIAEWERIKMGGQNYPQTIS